MCHVDHFNVAYELCVVYDVQRVLSKMYCINFGVQQLYIWPVCFHYKVERTRQLISVQGYRRIDDFQ